MNRPTEPAGEPEKRTEWPLLAAALLFLVAYAAPIIDPGLPRSTRQAAGWTVTGTWALFAVDYLVRLGLSGPDGSSSVSTRSTWPWSRCPCSDRCGYYAC